MTTRKAAPKQSTDVFIQIERPRPPAIVQEMAPLVKQAQAFEVVDVDSHAECLDREKRLRRAEKGTEEHFAKAKKAASDAHKEIVRSVAALVGPFAEARGIYFKKSDAFEREETRKAEAEQRRLQAEAARQEEERKIMDAEAAEEAGDAAEAEAIRAEPVEPPSVIVAPQVATVAGVSKRETWSAEVHDKGKLIAYVAKHPEWESLLDPNMPNLNRLAVSQHKALAIPGVRAVSASTRTTRS